jgi:two-component system sensor kinase
MVWVACADGSIEYFNQRTLDYSGLRAEELSFWGWLKLIHPEDASLAEKTWKQALSKAKPYAGEYRIRRKDGIYLWHQVRAIPVSDSNGRIGKWIGTWSDIEGYKLAERLMREQIACDISDREKTERGLHENQARFERLIDSAMDAIISINESQHVVLFNAAAERMFGCSATEALGRPLDKFIPARFRATHRAHVRAFGATGVTSRTMSELGELIALRADGREFPIEAAISQTEVSGAKLFTVILRDITERRVAEEALSRSEGRLRALTARLQRAHEEEAIRIARELHDQMGRCLTTLKIDITLIEQMVSGQLTTEAIHSIHEKTQMMQGAIDEMVHVVRKISTELRPGILDDLGLPAAIEWQAKDFQKRSGVLCVLNIIEEDLDLSREEATAIFRIFQEVLTNVARHSKAEKIWVQLDVHDGMVVLEVEDNGIGIDPATLGQSKALGLLGMRERAAMFGGHVEIAGVPGKGTTVIVRMPFRGANHEGSDR